LSTELTTFSAILTFAAELEGTLAAFYESAAQVSGDLAEAFENNGRKAAKRRQRLIAIRQDNITEMVLEPITGLNAEDYTVTDITAPGTPTDRAEALAQAITIEGRAEKFYLETGPKLNVTEPRRAFQKMAQEAGDRLAELKAV
jgi:hypothetical protein